MPTVSQPHDPFSLGSPLDDDAAPPLPPCPGLVVVPVVVLAPEPPEPPLPPEPLPPVPPELEEELLVPPSPATQTPPTHTFPSGQTTLSQEVGTQ